jgi:hypothetical protein
MKSFIRDSMRGCQLLVGQAMCVKASSTFLPAENLGSRLHEALRTTPAIALGIADHVWSIGELLDAALATQSITPVPTAPDRRRQFRVIDGGRK